MKVILNINKQQEKDNIRPQSRKKCCHLELKLIKGK